MVLLGFVLFGAVAYIIVSDYLFLKKDVSKIVRVKLYKEMMFMQWTMLLLVCLAWIIGGFSWRDLVMIEGTKTLTLTGPFMTGFLTSIFIVMIVMIIIMSKNAKKESSSVPIVGNIDFMLPQTKRERIVFIFVAATAGICEEIIFRGAMAVFLLNLPFDMSLTIVAIVSAIIFGAVHYYQGWKGMIATGLFGFAMFNLYTSTGSLLLPILVHFLIDLKFVFKPTVGKKEAEVSVQ